MKNIKIIISVILLTLVSSIYAQRFGIQSAGALTGLQQSTSSTQGDFNVLSGALIGGEFEFMLNQKLSINTAALFEFRAGRYDISWYKNAYTFTRELYYGQLPIHLVYRKALGEKSNLLYFAGPRFNLGLFGKTNEHYTLASINQIDESSCFGGANQMQAMDFAFDFGFGIEIERVQFKLNYSFPITNSVNVSDLSTLKQHQLQLAIGVTLHKFKPKKEKASQTTTPAASN